MYPIIMNWGCFIYSMLVPLDTMADSALTFFFLDLLHWTTHKEANHLPTQKEL